MNPTIDDRRDLLPLPQPSNWQPTACSATPRSQREAGLSEGPFDDPSKNHLDMLAIGIGIGLLIGLALIDLVETFQVFA